MASFSSLINWIVLATTTFTAVSAHNIITYPGWRGDNLHTNETFPYGMQWMYPCGGMPPSTNRTKWPISGGAVAIQPGWFQGHSTALMYINMGFGTNPPNYSNPMVPVFQIKGPTNEAYPGIGFCLPQVPLPINAPRANVKVGDNATIQIVEAAKHGAGLFNCVDIIFAEDGDPAVEEVTPSNCFNDSRIGFNQIFGTEVMASGADLTIGRLGLLSGGIPLLSLFIACVLGFGMFV
ncbi:hypothetical protein L228DRAFT_268441 [Xylona heveae TC161]|uniref:Copper acquisition factor BIM1-like domain-containing protein n=1 Tax=Xylona heveae (strain CBS 132557 / TC161) TaxID=1328760 RepID=A0A165H7E8_XYLHT|nr:hypothetical protein L228DRAFT_268441 [Xylona heveae TC161]KZF23086.1 hypothetical protein L228DRAFT_268441 [Xylona heveae TC161]